MACRSLLSFHLQSIAVTPPYNDPQVCLSLTAFMGAGNLSPGGVTHLWRWGSGTPRLANFVNNVNEQLCKDTNFFEIKKAHIMRPDLTGRDVSNFGRSYCSNI